MASEIRILPLTRVQRAVILDALACWVEHHPTYEPGVLAEYARAVQQLEDILGEVPNTREPGDV